MASAEKKSSLKPYIHVLIILFFMFGFQYLPPIGTITPLGMQTLGIFIGVIYGWSAMDMIWPSFLGLMALSLMPGSTAISVFKTGFGDRITIVIFLFLVFGELINKVGLSKYIADWCISRKIVLGKPYAILAMFCLAGSLISAFVNCFAGIILMWGVFYSFCKEADLNMGEAYPKVALIAIIYTCVMAGDILPFMGISLLIVTLQDSMLNLPMPYISFALVQLIMVLLASVIYFAFVKFIVRPNTAKVAAYRPKQESMAKMTGEQKFVFVLLLGLMLLLFLPGILPAGLPLTAILKALDIAGALALVFVVYYVVNLRSDKGLPFIEIVQGVNWSLVLMFATVAPLAAAVSNPESGILGYVSMILGGLFSDTNPYVFVILIMLLGSIITQFCNNVAIVLMVMPIMYSFAMELGADPIILGVLAAFNLNIAFCTPAASGPAAMMFSNTQWIGTKDSYIHGFVIFIINMAVTILGLPIAQLLF